METDDVGKAVRYFIGPCDCLDNFSAFRVLMWGRDFDTAEHAYQYAKFIDNRDNISLEKNVADEKIASMVQQARSALEAQEIAAFYRGSRRKDWDSIKLDIMELVKRAKASQHEKISRFLIQSRGREIIEASPNDSYWGEGPDGLGDNHSGKIWMKIRDDLPQE